MASLSDPLGEALRVRARPAEPLGGLVQRDRPGLLLFDHAGSLICVNEAARAWLAELPHDQDLPSDPDHSSWPRFRIAVNTGPAVVGNVGADIQRSFTVIGDTINLAARLQAKAPPGVVIGPTTRENLGDRATVVPLGTAQLKGKREPVPLYRLVSIAS